MPNRVVETANTSSDSRGGRTTVAALLVVAYTPWQRWWLTLVLAVALYGEPFGRAQAIAFGSVWAALVLFSWDALRVLRLPPAHRTT